MNTKQKDLLITAAVGLIGAVVGIIATSYMNIYSDQKQKRYDVALQSMKYDLMDNAPVEFIDLKQLVDQVTTLSSMSEDALEESAALMRQYPHCASALSDECRIYMVKMITIMRKELNAGYVSENDIDTILKPKYDKAIRAAKTLGMR